MRRDVKIGIGVGLGVVVIALIYFVATSGPSDEPVEPTADQEPDDTSNVVHIDPEPQEPEHQRRQRDRDTEPDPLDSILRDRSDSDEDRTADRDTTADDTRRRTVSTFTPARLSPAEPDTPEPSLSADRSVTDRPRTYTVQEGDHGFWGIAQELYGHGKHWELIRDANPDVDSNALRAGQNLRIPAIPAEDRAQTRSDDTTRGSIGSTADGRRTYTVEQGDRGFWGISQKVYGTGVHADLIAEANPHIDSGSLRPGQTLVIPPEPEGRQASESRRQASSTADDDTGDQRTYTVQQGDRGFWGVAESVYGDGTLWTVIQEANPDVDSGSLRVGETLVIPPKPQRESSRADADDDGGSRQSASGRPRFD